MTSAADASAPPRDRLRVIAYGRTVSQGDGFHLQTLSVQFKKKRNQEAFERASKVIGALVRLDRERQCELLYFDESGFSPNPSVQYGWSKSGQTRSAEPLAARGPVHDVSGREAKNGEDTAL
jgi:hypothetical protein